MSSKAKLYIISLVLISMGLGLTLYKHFTLGFPLAPGQKNLVWTLEAEVHFNAKGGPASVSLALPEDNNGYRILSQDYASPGYGFLVRNDGAGRHAEWTTRNAKGRQTLYYTLQIEREKSSDPLLKANNQSPQVPAVVDLGEPYQTAAQSIIEQAHAKSSDRSSFTYQIIQALNGDSQNAVMLQKNHISSTALAKNAVKLLNMNKIPARIVRGVNLEDKRRNQPIISMLEVFDGKKWLIFNPKTGDQGLPNNFILWQNSGNSLLDVTGGHQSKISFSVSSNTQSARSLALQTAKNDQAALIDFSIYSLPISEQNAFKTILLVPIGTLIVVFLRIFVGIRTSGTFMPILMALAFMQTTLLTGLAIFIIIVSIGLWIRSTLSHLNLLLVARISSVVIVVIGIIACLAIISYKLGINQVLTVTFFPMIILSWTIERMSVLWEEEGSKEVVIQGGGSLLVASIAYLAMTNPWIEHLTFNFPELLLVVLAMNLLMGQYAGYRLSELIRFQPLIKEP